MMSSHLTEAQEVFFSQAVERLLAIPEVSSRQIFLHQNPALQDPSVVLYLASKVPKMAREDADRALQLASLAIPARGQLRNNSTVGQSKPPS